MCAAQVRIAGRHGSVATLTPAHSVPDPPVRSPVVAKCKLGRPRCNVGPAGWRGPRDNRSTEHRPICNRRGRLVQESSIKGLVVRRLQGGPTTGARHARGIHIF